MLDGLVDFVGGGVIPIFAIIVVVVLVVAYMGSRYKVAGANEALIVSGRRERGPPRPPWASRWCAAGA